MTINQTEPKSMSAGTGELRTGIVEKRPTMVVGRVKRTLSQAGQGMTEYIMIIGLVALLVYAALQLFGKDIQGLFNKANTDLTNISNNAT